MSAIFVPDEEPQLQSAQAASGAEHDDLREAVPSAVRSMLPWLVIAAVLLPLGLLAMKRPILAANQLLLRGGDAYWGSCWMPPILFGFFGLIFGGVVGWRISSGAGLTGTPAWLVGALAAVLLLVVGWLTATSLFSPAIPAVCWISLGATTVGSLLGVSAFAFWID